MIYLDASVALAALFGEARRPDAAFWQEDFVSSRLLTYELHVRLHARGLLPKLSPALEQLLARLEFVELAAAVLDRATEPMPQDIRTLDALHLATLAYLHREQTGAVLASYDRRMLEAARAMGFDVLEP